MGGRDIGGGAVGACWAGQLPLGRLVTGMDVVGGLPAACCLPTSNVSSGPSGLPMLTRMPSEMSTVGTRRPLTNRPLRLPLSMAIHRP